MDLALLHVDACAAVLGTIEAALVPPVVLRGKTWGKTLEAVAHAVTTDEVTHVKLGAVVLASAALSRRMRWRAKRELGLSSLSEAHVGMLTFVQRSDSALRLNPHLHTLMLDGVYVLGRHGLRFEHLPEPSAEEVALVAEQTAKALFAKLDIDWDAELMSDEPLLAHVYQHSAGGSDALGPRIGNAAVRLVDARYVRRAQGGPQRAEVQGLGVYADRVINANDKKARLRLCRYLSRPPLKAERLRTNHDGRLLYALKRPWADGTTAIALHPLDFISRLCALVPPLRFHLLRFFGVLSAHSSLTHPLGKALSSCVGSRRHRLPALPSEMKIRAFITASDEAARYLSLGPRAPPLPHQILLQLSDGPQLGLRFA